MSIDVGDLITAFCLGRVRYGKVIDVYDARVGDFRRAVERFGSAGYERLHWIPIIPPVPHSELWLNVEDENVTWLAGHHSIESNEIKALRVARALR